MPRLLTLHTSTVHRGRVIRQRLFETGPVNELAAVAFGDGGSFVVTGTSVTAGNKALIQQGRIIGAAGSLPTYTVTVS